MIIRDAASNPSSTTAPATETFATERAVEGISFTFAAERTVEGISFTFSATPLVTLIITCGITGGLGAVYAAHIVTNLSYASTA